MLQIKNTLGGGKPEGLYAWKKSENVFDKIEYSNKASASYPVDNIDGAAVVYNDYLYYIGGSVNLGSVYRFDGNSWSSVKMLPTPTDAKYGPAVVYNGKIHYFYGGGDGVTHYSYDGTDWTQEIDSPMDMGYQSALVYNDKMYVLGRGSMYRYDNTEWTLIGSLPVNTSVTTAIVHDGKIHIVGGMNATSSSKLKSHYVYDGVNWSADIDLPGINSGHYLVSFHGDLYSLGGTNYSYAQKMLKYTGTSWEQVATLPFEFYKGGCAVYKGEIYIIGTNYSTTYYRYVYSIAREIYRLDFIDYVVSDKETAYPDGGEKGGYWYEKVVDGAKIAYGSMSNAGSTSTGNLTIEHGLGVKPDLFIVYKAHSGYTRSNYYGQMYLHLSDKLSSFYIDSNGLYDIMSYFYSSWDVLVSASEYVDENEFIYSWLDSASANSHPFCGTFGWVAVAF